MAILAFAGALHAEQDIYVVGANISVTSGGSNNLNGVSGSSANRPFSFFYALYPSINLAATGAHSTLGFSYSFGLNRTVGQQNANSGSHQASMYYSKSLGSRWNFSLAGSFQQSIDLTTFNALRGVAAPAQSFNFLVNPTGRSRPTRTGNASVQAGYSLSDKSTLSVSGSYSLRNYVGTGPTEVGLSNQQFISGGISYSRRTSGHESWSIGYTGAYDVFKASQNMISQSTSLGYSNNLRHDLTFAVSVGASFVNRLGSGERHLGYNTSVSVGKTIQSSKKSIQNVQTTSPTKSLNIFYSQSSGQPTGLGTVSDTRSAGFGISRAGRTVSEFADVSVFDAVGTLGNTFRTRGASATANMGISLTRRLSVQWGGEYQRNNQVALLGLTQKRLFVSVRFGDPRIWRFSR